ncbi:MAG: hypothetical protein JG718_06085 [Candidatus Thiothrix moscowensis]|nr:hypothetical protein [Candidatus Thiothrix moscowensis]
MPDYLGVTHAGVMGLFGFCPAHVWNQVPRVRQYKKSSRHPQPVMGICRQSTPAIKTAENFYKQKPNNAPPCRK